MQPLAATCDLEKKCGFVDFTFFKIVPSRGSYLQPLAGETLAATFHLEEKVASLNLFSRLSAIEAAIGSY